MKRALKLIYQVTVAITVLFFAGCTDKNAVIDQNTEIANHNWPYIDKFNYPVKIEDEKVPYNLYMNLRVTADYRYSNMFVLISQTGPDKKKTIKRYELKLAGKDGEWLGAGSGNFYTYQLLFLTNYKFPAKGIYTFQLEQNMRDNPLREVANVGLRVEEVTP
ncbi:MAG: gliding motility lipoprotein GldH [Mucilaginibacter sp.]|nr:gliding motility lipoprotein GldH [Mucilaginibacter sp.]MDB5015343.1 gliding motility lipoprotein GldH [Mucilaginibacter sp.]MDB5138239.1 gliding motility lipoprotein GldH [Mucilaginibacter sp.]